MAQLDVPRALGCGGTSRLQGQPFRTSRLEREDRRLVPLG
jgi:hypothetical protein